MLSSLPLHPQKSTKTPRVVRNHPDWWRTDNMPCKPLTLVIPYPSMWASVLYPNVLGGQRWVTTCFPYEWKLVAGLFPSLPVTLSLPFSSSLFYSWNVFWWGCWSGSLWVDGLGESESSCVLLFHDHPKAKHPKQGVRTLAGGIMKNGRKGHLWQPQQW